MMYMVTISAGIWRSGPVALSTRANDSWSEFTISGGCRDFPVQIYHRLQAGLHCPGWHRAVVECFLEVTPGRRGHIRAIPGGTAEAANRPGVLRRGIQSVRSYWSPAPHSSGMGIFLCGVG